MLGRSMPIGRLVVCWGLCLCGLSFGQPGPSAPETELPNSTELPNPTEAALPGSNAQEPQGITDVEIMLQLTEAERNFDRLLSESRLPTSTPMRPKYDPARIGELKQSLEALLTQIDAMVSSDKVLPVRQIETRLKRLSVLYEGSKIDPGTYKPQFNAYIDQMLVDARQDEGDTRTLVSLVTAYRILEKYVDSDEANDTVLAAIEQYIQSYPLAPFGFELLIRRARNLRDIGDNAGAMEVYRKTQELFQQDKRGDLVDSIVKRFELIGQPASIEGPTMDGGEFSLANHQGKVVLVDFWASWCLPCVQMFPKLRKLQAKYESHGLQIVGVSLDESREAAKETVDRETIAWPQILFEGESETGFDNPIAQKYSVTFIPMYFLIDKEGKFILTDYLDATNLERKIVQALGLPGPLPDPEPASTEESEAASPTTQNNP